MLTIKQLQNLKPIGKEYQVSDRDGLSIRVNAGGSIAFQYRFRWHGKWQRLTLGHYNQLRPQVGISLKEARSITVELAKQRDSGINPIEHKREQERLRSLHPTVSNVVEEFIQRALIPNRTRPEQPIRMLEKDVIPVIGKYHIDKITLRVVIKLLDQIVDRGSPVMANRLKTLLNQLFEFAIQRDLISINPIRGLKKEFIGGKEETRERVLNETEITHLLQDIPQWSTHETNKLAIHFILASGQRITAVLGARWEHVDLDDRVWLIPKSSATSKTKSRKDRELPISDYMAAVLSEQAIHSSRTPFVWAGVINPNKPILKDSLTSVIRRANYAGLPHWTPHDLRRTLITQMAELKIPVHVVEKIAGHELQGVMKIYNRYSYFEEQHTALDNWGQRLQSLEDQSKSVAP